MTFSLSLLGCCFDVGLWLVLVLAFWSVLSFGCESGLPPLWPKNEKQPIRNFTFYISVNDFPFTLLWKQDLLVFLSFHGSYLVFTLLCVL